MSIVKLKNYTAGLSFNRITFIPHFVNIVQLAQTLKWWEMQTE